MATKPAPIARSHTQHTAAAQAKAAAHAALHQQHVSQHAAAVQRKKDAAAARYARLHPAPLSAISSLVAPAPTDTLATPTYGGGSVSGAVGYGSGYQYDESQADVGANQQTGGPSDTQKKSSGLSTKTKIWLGVGAGVLVVGFVAYRKVTAPLRHYRRVRGLVQGIAGGFKNLKSELAK